MQSFPNYWLGIMAAAFAIGMAVWIGLVFYADRHPHGYGQQSWQRGEVTGGSFKAAQGGRQVTPHPGETPDPMPGDAQPPFVPPAPRQPPEQSEPERDPARTESK